MKAWADWLLNSCSRMIRPGVLDPVSHLVMEELMACAVVPPVVNDQSSVLQKGQNGLKETERIHTPDSIGWARDQISPW